MDKELRELERRYLQGQLHREEVIFLRSRYKNVFGYCPAWFVSAEINDIINSYMSLKRRNHSESVIELIRIIDSIELSEENRSLATNSTNEHKVFGLEETHTISNQSINEDPLLSVVINIDLLPVSESLQRDRREKRQRAMEYLQQVICATLEQSGYHACTDSLNTWSQTNMAIVGFPKNPHFDIAKINDRFRAAWQIRFGRQLGGWAKMAAPVNVSNLQVEVEIFEDDGIQWLVPGSLKSWMQLIGVSEGILILAAVPNSVFQQHSVDSREARAEINRISDEADQSFSPEMIYLLTPGLEPGIHVVPAPIFYFKTCQFLRLIAEV